MHHRNEKWAKQRLSQVLVQPTYWREIITHDISTIFIAFHIRIHLQCISMCACRANSAFAYYTMNLYCRTHYWQIEVHAVCYHRAIEIDDENVTVLVAKRTYVSTLTQANTLTLTTLKHKHTHKRTRTVKRFPIDSTLNFVAAMCVCICIRIYMHGWTLGACVFVWHSTCKAA